MAPPTDTKKDALQPQQSQAVQQAQPVQPQAGLLDTMAARFGIQRNKIAEVLRGTVMKPDRDGNAATDAEIAAFLIVADNYGLNPFIREIYAFRAKGGGIIAIIPIDGWVTIINRQRELDGIQFEDHLDGEGKITAITCRITRSDRKHPIEVTEYMDECMRETEPWKNWPNRMLRHKALIQCARYAFGLAGVHDEDEALRIVDSTKVTEERQPMIPRRRSEQVLPAAPQPSHSFHHTDGPEEESMAGPEPKKSNGAKAEPESQPAMFNDSADPDPLISADEAGTFWDKALEIGWKKQAVTDMLKKDFHVAGPKDLRKSQFLSAWSVLTEAH